MLFLTYHPLDIFENAIEQEEELDDASDDDLEEYDKTMEEFSKGIDKEEQYYKDYYSKYGEEEDEFYDDEKKYYN